MRFQTPLVPGTLIRRYNRFLCDVALESGPVVTAHCPNPGSMMGLKDPGLRVWLEPNDDPKKKLKYGWRLAALPNGATVGIDTSLANKIVAEALSEKRIPLLAPYETLRAEVKYATNSRVDFLATQPGLPDLYLEVKSVTLCRSGTLLEFPDSVTARGAKHLADLASMVQQGHRAALLFLVQHSQASAVTVAQDLDPTYAQAFHTAQASGVDMLCFGTDISPEGITLSNALPLQLPNPTI